MLMLYLSMIESSEDKSKFERIYYKYRASMMYTAEQILHDHGLSEDCVHNAFLNVLKNLDMIKDPDSRETKALLVIITQRRAVDMYRKIRKEVSMEDAEQLIPAIAPPGDEGLADCMTKLPASYRSILILRYIHGYNTREIGKLIGITQSGVRKKLARAKEKLREELERI